MGWHQNVKFLIAWHMVDDHPAIVGQRGECPPICTAPLYAVHTVLMFIIFLNHHILLGPVNKKYKKHGGLFYQLKNYHIVLNTRPDISVASMK